MSESPAAATPASGDEPRDDVPMNDADGNAGDGHVSDDGSELSDVNEDEFENFDVNAITIEEQQGEQSEKEIDQDALKGVQVRRRERPAGEEPKKKKKESRRDKQQAKKARKRRGEDDDDLNADGPDGEARGRRRKAASEGGEKKKKVREETPEDQLEPEERIRREMEKRVAAVIKKPGARRKKAGGDDLSSFMDEEIVALRDQMMNAAKEDNDARLAIPPRPAMNKLKLLPKVVALLSRNGREVESAIVDPENNLMEAVKFFLEPLGDGSLPAHDIQQKLFDALLRLPITKETLFASGIGKVILFYTKTKKPEPNIKRAAERLLAEWTRPILKRSDDYRQRSLQEVEYDPSQGDARATGSASQDPNARAKAAREKALERPNPGNRARLERVEQKTYTVVPKSNLSNLQKRRRD